MSPELDPRFLSESSIKLITELFHHPVKFIITDFICSLINCMVPPVGGTTHHIITCLTVYFDIMMVITLIFVDKGISTTISRIINFTGTKYPTMLNK